MDLQLMGKRAVTAKYELQSMSSSQKKETLLFIADRLIKEKKKRFYSLQTGS